MDAGDGEIALHNEQTGRFLMISDQHIWGHPAAASHLEEQVTFGFFRAVQSLITVLDLLGNWTSKATGIEVGATRGSLWSLHR